MLLSDSSVLQRVNIFFKKKILNALRNKKNCNLETDERNRKSIFSFLLFLLVKIKKGINFKSHSVHWGINHPP